MFVRCAGRALVGARAAARVKGRTYGKILDFSFGHEIVLELVSGSDFMCFLRNLSSLTRFKRSWAQVWPENGPKAARTRIYILIS